MNRKIGVFITLFIAMSLMMSGIQDAQARRLGGGSSFGSKPSYSTPFQHPTSPNSFSQPSRSPSQQQAAMQNQAARQGMANRGGLMGMLGGLALGGFLGSLLFGGAFEQFNFLDILLFAGFAYLIYKLFAAKTVRQDQAAANTYGRNSYQDSGPYQGNEAMRNARPGFDTDLLFNKDKSQQRSVETNIPQDFDRQAFLSGAERAFRHLQAAWDKRDLATIRGLSTDKVFAEIQEQLRSLNAANKTEVLQLRAELLAVRTTGSDLEASVLFDSLMREDDAQAQQVREVWHFIKPINSLQTKWFLDGIQQVAE
jgi:predicted lipid-binding transport protein (Tim44 family)